MRRYESALKRVYARFTNPKYHVTSGSYDGPNYHKRRAIVLLVFMLILSICLYMLYTVGYKDGQKAPRAISGVERLYTISERQYILKDLGFYKGPIDGLRGTLTIDAEKLYYRWYGHCMAAGKRVDPNILEWEDEVHGQ